MAIKKQSVPKTKSAFEKFGKCPECSDGDIILHKSKNYFICTRRLADGSCSQTFDRYRLKAFGIRCISKDGMAALLNDKMLYFEKLLHPTTGEPLNCLCQIYLKRKENYRTGEWQYMPHVEIFWDKKVDTF